MPAQAEKYNSLGKFLANNTLDLTGTLKCLLVTSNYTFDAAHTAKGQVDTQEVVGTGYTAGGATLANVSITETGGVGKVDFDDISWPTATITARRAIFYQPGLVNGVQDPLLFSMLLDDTPADVSTTGIDFVLSISSSGLLTL